MGLRHDIVRSAGLLVAVGALLAGAKAASVLLGFEQPPLLLSTSSMPLAAGLLVLARWARRRVGSSVRLTLATLIAWIAAAASAAQVGMEVAGAAPEPAESLTSIAAGFGPPAAALLIGLALRSARDGARRIARRALLVGIAFVPLLVAGGIVAMLAGDRYLELGLLATSFTWLGLAHAAWTRHSAAETTSSGSWRLSAAAAASWVCIAVVAGVHAGGDLSYDAFNRTLAVPIAVSLFAWLSVRRASWLASPPVRAAFVAATVAWVLLLVGNVVEFWGVLLQDEPNAHAASQLGLAEHWVGSDIGWMVFGPGMLLLTVAGMVLAATASGVAPPRVRVFLAMLGLGVLAGNLIGRGPLFIVYALYGMGWGIFGRWLRQHHAEPMQAHAP